MDSAIDHSLLRGKYYVKPPKRGMEGIHLAGATHTYKMVLYIMFNLHVHINYDNTKY